MTLYKQKQSEWVIFLEISRKFSAHCNLNSNNDTASAVRCFGVDHRVVRCARESVPRAVNGFFKIPSSLWTSHSLVELCEYNLIHNARLRHYIQLLFSISILPQRASGRELMWVKALTAEESPSSLQSPPLGLKKPFMFVFDLKGKYTPDAIYMYCRPAAHKCHAAEVQSGVCLELKTPLIRSTVLLHFAGNHDHWLQRLAE